MREEEWKEAGLPSLFSVFMPCSAELCGVTGEKLVLAISEVEGFFFFQIFQKLKEMKKKKI